MVWDFTFGAVSAATKGFTTLKKFIPDLPDIKETTIDIPSRPGLIKISKEFKTRIIPVTGILEGSSYADLLTKITAFNAFVFSEDDKELIFDDQTDRYYLAQKIKNEEINRGGLFCDRFLQFKCNDPFGYAVTGDDDNEAGIVVDGHTWNITNGGQYWVYPIITITANQIQSHLYIANNSVSGCRLDITKALAATDTLQIDSKNVTLKKNGTLSPAGIGDGGDGGNAFPILKEDANQLEVGTDDVSIDIDVRVQFNKIFL